MSVDVGAGDAERALRWAHETHTVLICLDPTFRIVYVNTAARRLLRLPDGQLIGRTPRELFPSTAGTELEQAYRHAWADQTPLTFDQYSPDRDIWYRMDIRPVPDGLDITVTDITATRRGRSEEVAGGQQAPALLDLVTETSLALSTTLDVGQAVQRLARLVIPRLGDWCIVSALDPETGQLDDVAVAHADPTRQPAVERYAAVRVAAMAPDSPIHQAVMSRRPVTAGNGRLDSIKELIAGLVSTPAARQQITALAPGCVAAVPLLSGGRAVGVLSLYRDAGHPLWTERELRAAADVAGRAGTALDNARLFTEQQRRVEVLQHSLLTDPPEPDHAEIVVRYLPAVEVARVGGDWYDAFIQPSGTTMLVIGDVVGHDIEAAAAMGQLRTLLRGIAAYSDAGPVEVLAGLDRSMALLGVRSLATAAVARLEQDDHERERGITRMRWSSAGHLPPLAVSADGEVTVLADWHGDLMLGVDPTATREEHVVTLGRDATVLFYTDGLIERRDTDLDDGVGRLCEALRELADLPLTQLCDAIVQRLVDGRPEDDVALVAVRLHRQDRPRPVQAGPNRVPDPIPPDPIS